MAASAWIGCDDPAPPKPTSQPATAPATAPSTAPAATKPVAVKKPPTDLLSTLLADNPDFPSTQPVAEALSLDAAARLIFKDPVYLCPRGDLWITRADAPPTQSQLKLAYKQTTHAIPDPVQFVYWRPLSNAQAEIISKDAGGNDLWITPTVRAPLPAGVKRDWSRAMFWNNQSVRAIVVPTEDGISILTLKDGEVNEQRVQLAEPGRGVICSAVFDVRGLLAWSYSPTQPTQVARFVDDKWTKLTPAQSWPEKLLYILPFADGSVLAIGEEAEGLMQRSLLVESTPINEPRVLELVKQLADKLPEVRESAQSELAGIGPAAWPVLERVQATQPAEARVRIRSILGNQVTPSIFGMKPEPGRGRLVSRLRDGGVVIWFEAGVSSVGANNVVVTTAPAWLSIRPGSGAHFVPESVWHEQRPEAAPIQAWGDEWILEHDVDGPMRWMGNHLVPLTKPTEKIFHKFVGIDAEGRWILKTIDASGPTLVLDPTMLDPKPKLPVWTIDAGRKKVGWDKDGWPVQDRGGYWVLKEAGWATLPGPDASKQIFTTIDPATTQAAFLLTDSAGTRYTNGLTAIEASLPGGKTLSWPLPPEATGEGVIDGKPVLIEAANRLFLFNSPGRIIRLKKQLDEAEPFKIDAVFTRHVPASEIQRIWKDPAGRIVIASHGSVLSVAFPEGVIGNELANRISSKALKEAYEEETTK